MLLVKGAYFKLWNTVDLRYNEIPSDWQNVFAITAVLYIGVLFILKLCYHLAEEYGSTV